MEKEFYMHFLSESHFHRIGHEHINNLIHPAPITKTLTIRDRKAHSEIQAMGDPGLQLRELEGEGYEYQEYSHTSISSRLCEQNV